MIKQNQPYSLEFQNFRRVHRNRAIGELFAIELEITEDDWHHLSDFPQDAIGELVLQWTERAEVPEKAKKTKSKGEFGWFWKRVRFSTIPNSLDLQEWLKLFQYREDGTLADVETVWKALHRQFQVESLTFISPETAIQAFDQANLPGVASIARRLAESER